MTYYIIIFYRARCRVDGIVENSYRVSAVGGIAVATPPPPPRRIVFGRCVPLLPRSARDFHYYIFSSFLSPSDFIRPRRATSSRPSTVRCRSSIASSSVVVYVFAGRVYEIVSRFSIGSCCFIFLNNICTEFFAPCPLVLCRFAISGVRCCRKTEKRLVNFWR